MVLHGRTNGVKAQITDEKKDLKIFGCQRQVTEKYGHNGGKNASLIKKKSTHLL